MKHRTTYSGITFSLQLMVLLIRSSFCVTVTANRHADFFGDFFGDFVVDFFVDFSVDFWGDLLVTFDELLSRSLLAGSGNTSLKSLGYLPSPLLFKILLSCLKLKMIP